MSDEKKWLDPEVSEIDELVADERRRMASKGGEPKRSRSVTPWIVAGIVLAAAVILLWASVFGS